MQSSSSTGSATLTHRRLFISESEVKNYGHNTDEQHKEKRSGKKRALQALVRQGNRVVTEHRVLVEVRVQSLPKVRGKGDMHLVL